MQHSLFLFNGNHCTEFPPGGPQAGPNSVQVLAALSHPFTTATLESDKTKHTFQDQTTLQPDAHISEVPQEQVGFNYHYMHTHTHSSQILTPMSVYGKRTKILS